MKHGLRHLIVLLALFVPMVSLFYHPQPAKAAGNAPPSQSAIQNGTYSWWDRNTIHADIAGVSYYFRADNGGSNGLVYNMKGSSCSGTLSVNNVNFFTVGQARSLESETAPSKINVNIDFIDPNSTSSNCQKTNPDTLRNISISNPSDSFNVFFQVSSDGRHLLTVGDDGNNYTQSGQYPDLFTRDSENGDPCQDVIQVLPNSGQYISYELDENGAGGSPPASIHAPASCKITGHPGYVKMAVKQKLGNAGALKNDANPNPNNPGGAPGGGGAGAAGQADTCDRGDFSFNWALCPIFNAVGTVSDFMFSKLIQPLLKTDPICLDGSGATCDNTIYKVWSSFRIYGDIFLIIALLVIVFGESIGGGLIDAYTAKKILPRLLAAAVLINLSIYIVAFMVDITNVVGGGLGGLLTAPLQNNGAFTIQPDGITQGAIGVFGAGGLIIGAFALGVTGIVLLLVGLAITGAIALLGVFVTLIIRQSIIIALILIAPVAFALWCLPNTASWFKRWWDTLFQMLLVYPIIIIIFAVADIMSYLTAHNGQGGALSSIISFMLLVIPLYLIPFTLRSSNRILGAVQGAMSNAGRQINAVTGRRAISGAGAQVGTNWEATRAGNRFRGGTSGEHPNFRGRVNRALQGGTLATPSNIGFNPSKMRERLAAARSTQTSALSGEAEKSAAARVVAGNDDLLAASLHGDGSEADTYSYLHDTMGQRGAELTQNVASIRQAKRDMGSANFEDFAAANLAGTGTGYKGGPAEMFETINRVAGNDRARATRILASARGQAERAKRVDLAGSGFATSAEMLGQLHDGKTTAAAVNEAVTDEVLNVKSAGEIGTARNNALKNMVDSLHRRTARAQVKVDKATTPEARAAAEHEYKRVLAHTASMLDVASQSSPENAQVIGGVLGQETIGSAAGTVPERYETRQATDIDGNPAIDRNTNRPVMESVGVGTRPKTYNDEIESLRSDPEFQQYRREYGSARSAAAAEAGQIPPDAGIPPEEAA